MRIKGPTNGAPPVDGVDAPDPTDHVGEVGEVAGSEGTTATQATGSVGATAPAAATGATDAVGQVAAQLRAGQITVDQAVEQLIDDAIARQLGGASGAKTLEPKLRELLRHYAESDPFLAARIRRLTLAK